MPSSPAVPAHAPSATARLQALARDDKWFVGTGGALLWAPPFPDRLDRPGYWDAAHWVQHPVAPLFTVALLDGREREVPLVVEAWQWRPDRLRVVWRPAGRGAAPPEPWRTGWTATGLRLVEHRYGLHDGRLVSSWTAQDASPAGLRLAALTAQPGPDCRDVSETSTGLRWKRTLRDGKGDGLQAALALDVAVVGEASAPVLHGARSEGLRPHPEWELGPFAEREPGSTGVRLEGLDERGWIYLAVVQPLANATEEVRFVVEVQPRGLHPGGAGAGTAGPGGRGSRTPGLAGAGVPGAGAATDAWTTVFEAFPRLRCSDPYLERAFDYRLYGLWLNRIEGGLGHIRHPAIAEGIEYFHVPISYSAQCHMREMRWCRDPAWARGSLLNFLDTQKDDGSFHGRVYPEHLERTDFYHADWGDALLAVERIHPDASFRARAYTGLKRYAEWMDRARDPEGSGLFTVVNHYETGQEYMSRYVVVDPDSDRNEWLPRLRLKGVDVTVYTYRLRRALATVAEALGLGSEARAHAARADAIGAALRERMWDDAGGIYTDVDASTGSRTGVRSAVGFYPLLTDLPDARQVERLLDTLTDPTAFWTEFPLPASALDDPWFDAEGLWKGKRHNCPWNGRVWPMTNSHVLEGLLGHWTRGHARAGATAATLLQRFVRLLFHDGDLSRPDAFEHYNPHTGRACVFRGIDDYQHSWVLDPLIRGVGGLEPTADGVRVHPLPLGLDHVSLENVVVRGHRLDVTVEGSDVRVQVDGRMHRGEVHTPLQIAL